VENYVCLIFSEFDRPSRARPKQEPNDKMQKKRNVSTKDISKPSLILAQSRYKSKATWGIILVPSHIPMSFVLLVTLTGDMEPRPIQRVLTNLQMLYCHLFSSQLLQGSTSPPLLLLASRSIGFYRHVLAPVRTRSLLPLLTSRFTESRASNLSTISFASPSECSGSSVSAQRT
jgi:hypothetical protein